RASKIQNGERRGKMRRIYTIVQSLAVISVACAWLVAAGLFAWACQKSAAVKQNPAPKEASQSLHTKPSISTASSKKLQSPNSSSRRDPLPHPWSAIGSAITGITVEPKEISLVGRRAEGRLVVTAAKQSGDLEDATPSAAIVSLDPKVVSVGPDKVLR